MKKNKEINVFLLTKNINQQLLLDLKKVNDQYGNFNIKEVLSWNPNGIIKLLPSKAKPQENSIEAVKNLKSFE